MFCAVVLGGCTSLFEKRGTLKTVEGAADASRVLAADSKQVTLEAGRFICFSLPDQREALSFKHFLYETGRREHIVYVHEYITEALDNVCDPKKPFSFTPRVERRGAVSREISAIIACCVAK